MHCICQADSVSQPRSGSGHLLSRWASGLRGRNFQPWNKDLHGSEHVTCRQTRLSCRGISKFACVLVFFCWENYWRFRYLEHNRKIGGVQLSQQRQVLWLLSAMLNMLFFVVNPISKCQRMLEVRVSNLNSQTSPSGDSHGPWRSWPFRVELQAFCIRMQQSDSGSTTVVRVFT